MYWLPLVAGATLALAPPSSAAAQNAPSRVSILERLTNRTGQTVNDVHYHLRTNEPSTRILASQAGGMATNVVTLTGPSDADVTHSGTVVNPDGTIDVWTDLLVSQKNGVIKTDVRWTADGVDVGPAGPNVRWGIGGLRPLGPDDVSAGRPGPYKALFVYTNNAPKPVTLSGLSFVLTPGFVGGAGLAGLAGWAPLFPTDIVLGPGVRTANLWVYGITFGQFVNWRADVIDDPELVFGSHEANSIVPEPSTVTLAAVGLAALVTGARRRARSG